jgi:hypothetical protein
MPGHAFGCLLSKADGRSEVYLAQLFKAHPKIVVQTNKQRFSRERKRDKVGMEWRSGTPVKRDKVGMEWRSGTPVKRNKVGMEWRSGTPVKRDKVGME